MYICICLDAYRECSIYILYTYVYIDICICIFIYLYMYVKAAVQTGSPVLSLKAGLIEKAARDTEEARSQLVAIGMAHSL